MPSVHRGSVIDSLQRLFETGTATSLSETQLLERFITRGDETAFESILLRHGPMVLRVCGHVLDDPHDVDDAFQATFLILVKKAGAIRDRAVLGTWLYGVARRVAIRARMTARRRQSCERTGMAKLEVADRHEARAEANEIRALVDEELQRLPQRYRAPLILCDLEGQTHEQAAALIRCPVGTVKSRLSRGRQRLRDGLARRGLATTALTDAPLLATETASAVPAELLNGTIKKAVQLVPGRAASAVVFSAQATQLMGGVMRSMVYSRLKIAAIAGLAVVFAAVAAVPSFVSRATVEPALAGEQEAAKSKTAVKSLSQANPSPKTPERGSERYQLDNGLTVILRPILGAKSTDLVVLYSIGSDHDPEGQSGLSHAVEHLYLTAAAGDRNARTIEEISRRYPEGANGQTGHRYTVFSTAFPEKDLDLELRDAAARMGSLRVTAEDLDRERPRLLNEISNMFGGFPALSAINNARELVRPTAHGGRAGGLAAHVRAITPEQVQAFWQRYYKPRNAIVALAGAVDRAVARKAIAEHFGKLPAGEQRPSPSEPGRPQFGASRELNVASLVPDAEATACLAYAAPQPGSDLYVPFLVLVTRLWAAGPKLGSSGPTGSPVFFTPLDDGTVVALLTTVKPGETAPKAYARIENVVAETLEPKLKDSEIASARQTLGMLIGSGDIPDEILANNPYGVIFSIGRREQLGIDSASLDKAFQAVTDQDLRRAAAEIFAPDRHAGAFIAVKK